MTFDRLGLVLLAGWGVVYLATVLLAACARRSWVDLVVVFSILWLAGCLLCLLHPMLGGGLLTVLPLVALVARLLRRTENRKGGVS